MTIGNSCKSELKAHFIAIAGCLCLAATPAFAQSQDDTGIQTETLDPVEKQELAPAGDPRISNKVAVFSGIDKITGRIITFDVYIDETVQFGALQVTPRVCFTRDESQKPKTTTFVEVDEITLDRKIRRIFTGWMFADSPGLNAVDHAVYDVWLKDCKMDSEVPAPA
ncbi:MAG: DUF2155 domain-containing protein [Pseudomonadota bacterium]